MRRILLDHVLLLMAGVAAAKIGIILPAALVLGFLLLTVLQRPGRGFFLSFFICVPARSGANARGVRTRTSLPSSGPTASLSRLQALTLLVSFLLGTCLFMGENQEAASAHRLAGKGRQWDLTVLSAVDRGEKGVQMVCRIPRGRGKVQLVTFEDVQEAPLLAGKRIRCWSALEIPEPAVNPHCYDQRTALRAKGIWLVGRTEGLKVLGDAEGKDSHFRARIIRWREGFFQALPGNRNEKAMLRGILLGDTSAMEDDVIEDFQKSGTAHVLAVSGLHIGCLYAAYQALRKKRPSRLLDVCFWILLLVYAAMTLWAVSVLRAVALLGIRELGIRTDRRYDLTTALAACGGLLTLVRPSVIFGVSFQLSFLAVLSMGVLVPRLQLWMPGKAASILGIQGGLLPYMMYMFNQAPLPAIIWNPPILFFMGLLVPLGVGALACSVLAQSLGPVLPLASSFFLMVFRLLVMPLPGLASLLQILGKLASAGGRFSPLIPSVHAWAVAGIYGLLFFLSSETCEILRLRKNRLRIGQALLAIFLSISLIAAACRSPFDQADLVMVDVGQGDCLHLRLAGGKDVFVDGGGKEGTDLGKKVLRPYLLKNGRRDLDLALVTHLHTDHYKGIRELSRVFPVRKAMTKGVRGDAFRIGPECRVELLGPEAGDQDQEDENRNSLIFRITLKGKVILVTGDLSEEGERLLLERYRGTGKLRADILKVGHHGSRFSSCSDFLQEVRPEVALIGVGRKNPLLAKEYVFVSK